MYLFKFVYKLLFILFVSAHFNAHAVELEKAIQILPAGTNITLLVQPVGKDRPTVDYDSQKMMIPASTQKVVTALAALLQLGEDYKFTTTFETNATIKKGVLNGDLIVRFTGDPTFTRPQLRAMVQGLTRHGIKRIDGKIIINTAVFASHSKAPGWSWNNLTHCFSAPPTAAIVDGNCFYLTLVPAKKANQLATIKIPSYSPINIVSKVKTIAEQTEATKYCELDVIAQDNNRYILTGCIEQKRKPMPLVFAVQDGTNYAGALLKAELEQAKIKIKGQVERQTTYQSKGKLILASNQSEPLRNLLNTMLKKSDNLIADTLFRTIGREYFGVAGTWRSSADAVREVLQKSAEIDLGNSVVIDGSGLSRQNLISASTMMQILQYIALHDEKLGLIAMLPVSGKDGTLIRRKSLKSPQLTGQILAKTGMLDGVFNLVGFITAQNGQRLAFVQFVSGYSFSPNEGEKKQGPLIDFETQLYQDIYSGDKAAK